MPRLFVIDDRDQTIDLVQKHLTGFDFVTRCDRQIPCQVCPERDLGCPLKCAHDYGEAAETLARLQALPDLVVLDLHFARPEDRLLPEDKSDLPTEPRARKQAVDKLRRRQGWLILERLRRDHPALPVVMLTTTGAAPEAGTSDPLVYFCQNDIVDSRSLTAEITRVLALSHEAQEGPIFWGRTPAMAELRRNTTVLARLPLPLLVEGETGTGKSFLAEHVIHPRSGARGPLVVTDLSTIPAALIPAHLFGARRGAYTGAVDDHAGVFEQAHEGTLFLDEIGNLDLDLQRQLLLVLERGVVTRLGDTRPRPARPKLVAATNQDLANLVAQGRFRVDLYMRLNPATKLQIPPLRQRQSDLSDLTRFAFLSALKSDSLRPLVRAFLAQFPTPMDFDDAQNSFIVGRPSERAARQDAFTVFLGKEALSRIGRHTWPGNLRELSLFAQNALVFALTRHLDGPAQVGPSLRAPAILEVPDSLVGRLMIARDLVLHPPVSDEGIKPLAGRSVQIEVPTSDSFQRISVQVERQYMQALFQAAHGDLALMAQGLLGSRGDARRVHLRLNQLGLKLRDLRAGLST